MPDEELSADLTKRIVQLDRDLKGIEPSDKKRGKILSIISSQLTATFKSYVGPIPSPENLKQYNDLLPGTAERLISMAERQSAHRIELEKKVISRQLEESTRGQYFGLIVALCFLAASYSLGMNGHDGLAGVLGGTTLVSLVAVFVIGKKKQREDLQSKA